MREGGEIDRVCGFGRHLSISFVSNTRCRRGSAQHVEQCGGTVRSTDENGIFYTDCSSSSTGSMPCNISILGNFENAHSCCVMRARARLCVLVCVCV